MGTAEQQTSSGLTRVESVQAKAVLIPYLYDVVDQAWARC